MTKVKSSDLIKYAESKIGVPYVYGMKMQILTKEMFQWLQNTYGKSLVWNSDASKIGQICCDCSGLISSFTNIVQSSSQMQTTAKECNPISTIKQAPVGALVWQHGHVGIYLGNGEYIAEDGSAFGCRKNKLSNAKFTHWLLMNYIDYDLELNKNNTIEEKQLIPVAYNIEPNTITNTDIEIVSDISEKTSSTNIVKQKIKLKIIKGDKKPLDVELEAINENDKTYYWIREIAELLDFSVVWDEKNKTVILNKCG